MEHVKQLSSYTVDSGLVSTQRTLLLFLFSKRTWDSSNYKQFVWAFTHYLIMACEHAICKLIIPSEIWKLHNLPFVISVFTQVIHNHKIYVNACFLMMICASCTSRVSLWANTVVPAEWIRDHIKKQGLTDTNLYKAMWFMFMVLLVGKKLCFKHSGPCKTYFQLYTVVCFLIFANFSLYLWTKRKLSVLKRWEWELKLMLWWFLL